MGVVEIDEERKVNLKVVQSCIHNSQEGNDDRNGHCSQVTRIIRSKAALETNIAKTQK